jgi:hypothetical protein
MKQRFNGNLIELTSYIDKYGEELSSLVTGSGAETEYRRTNRWREATHLSDEIDGASARATIP